MKTNLPKQNRKKQRRNKVEKFSRIQKVQPFTDRITFLFNDVYTVTSTTSPGRQVFKINSLYDPDQTGTGKQPYLYDQMMAIYSQYQVVTARVHVRFTNSAAGVVMVGGYPSTLYSSITDLNTPSQYPYAQSTILTENGASVYQDFTWKFNIHKMLDLAKSDDTLKAAYNYDPATLLYFSIYSQNVDETTSAATVNYVKIEFDAVLSKPVQQSDSLMVKKQIDPMGKKKK